MAIAYSFKKLGKLITMLKHRQHTIQSCQIYQHPDSVPGSWSKAAVLIKFLNGRHTAALFDDGADYVIDKGNCLSDKKIIDLLLLIIDKGYKQIDTDTYRKCYGVYYTPDENKALDKTTENNLTK